MKSMPDLLKKITAKTKEILWILGLHAFLIILLLVFLDIIFGGFILYRYVFLAEKEEPVATGSVIKFDSKSYQDVLEELQAREQSAVGFPAASQSESFVQSQKN